MAKAWRREKTNLWIQTRDGAWRRVPLKFLLLPLGLFFALMIGSTFSINRTEDLFAWIHFKQFRVAKDLFLNSHSAALRNLLHLGPVRGQSDLPSLQLFVGDGTIDDMMRAKLSGKRSLGREPGGDRPYFPAYFIDESQKIQSAKVGFRGYKHFHHSPRKPSLRVKIRKADIAQGRRYVELSQLEGRLGLVNYIPEQLALKLELMVGASDYVRLFVNRKFVGVYLRGWRPGESLALALGRMPGSFFKGDAIGKYRGTDLWKTTKAWNVFGESESAQAFFQEFLDYLNQPPTPEHVGGLSHFLNLESFAKWNALMHTMGSLHTDSYHNHLYFLDPLQGQLEPVVWDVNGLGKHLTPEAQIGLVPNKIIERLSRDPRWIHQRNLWLHKIRGEDTQPARFNPWLKELKDRLLPDLQSDANLSDSIPSSIPGIFVSTPFAASQVEQSFREHEEWMTQRDRTIEAYLQDSSFWVEDVGNKTRVLVFGNVGIEAVSPDRTWLLLPGRDFVPASEGEEFPHLTPSPLEYRLPVPLAQLEFRHALTKQVVTPKAESPGAASSPFCYHPEQLGQTAQKSVVLGPGLVEMSEDLLVESPQSLTVLPNTTLELGPGVSIVSTGPVTMVGTKEEPIVVKGSTTESWGTVSLLGASTQESQFRHVTMSGGSISSFRGIIFKGMFNVYNSGSLKIRDCKFGANYQGDDAVNFAGSTVEIIGSEWLGARSDGLDLDRCKGVVIDCRFRESGNDGLDVMTSEVRVDNTDFEGCGDKGLSVGEGSRVLIEKSRFRDCVIGSQVKDASRAAYLLCHFEDNKIGLDAYRKKWLYPSGGHIYLERSELAGPQPMIKVDSQSDAILVDNTMSGETVGQEGVQHFQSIPEDWSLFIKEMSKRGLHS